MSTSKTTSWTAEQKQRVDNWVEHMADEIGERINLLAVSLRKIDKRPRQCYSPEQPDVFFPHVAQGMLEDLIAELEDRV